MQNYRTSVNGPKVDRTVTLNTCEVLRPADVWYLAVEVPRLAEEAVLLIRTIRTAVLVVTTVGSRVTRSVSGTGELVLLTR